MRQYTPSMYPAPPIAFDCDPLNRNYPRWTAEAKRWSKYDRIYTNEEQVVALAQVVESTEYMSSDMLLNPSVPEFTVIARDQKTGVNTYTCYRKSLLKEEDILQDEINGAKRTTIPLIDAYMYFNNGGSLCNYVVTLAKCVLELDGHEITSTTQFISYVHDDPISRGYADYDQQFVFETNRTTKMLYMAVQMVSLERPEVISYGRTKQQAQRGESGKKSSKKRNCAHMVKTIHLADDTAEILAKCVREHIEITCPCWGVAGHWRTYKKTGKKVWIKPYRKGKERNNPDSYVAKTYELPGQEKEVIDHA